MPSALCKSLFANGYNHDPRRQRQPSLGGSYSPRALRFDRLDNMDIAMTEAEKIEAARKRVAEIDAKFEAATGWGSWMVMCANEREALADQFGFEHKNQARCGGRRTD